MTDAANSTSNRRWRVIDLIVVAAISALVTALMTQPRLALTPSREEMEVAIYEILYLRTGVNDKDYAWWLTHIPACASGDEMCEFRRRLLVESIRRYQHDESASRSSGDVR